ncbi:stomatin-like protein 2, mitochondrial [Trichonephila inaurata madagascariensis]|uniref:Stomatin-like protein 2, mitochondrial n=1 Tax=Trichonephila inaurata madagascariensis TaxID=2747483 RepID=A0A8X6XQW9_9ARAC|nr:stomatin-like protein 2, mitochondrial [Trichonephila inaurata madagascariensis]
MFAPLTSVCARRSKRILNKVVVLEDIFKLSIYNESISSRSFSVVPRESLQNHRSLSPKLLQLNIPHKESVRYAQSTPINTIIMFVPQQEAWVVERMGRFNRILQPGLNFLVPIVDKVKYVQSLKELAIDIPKQSAITLDNVTLNIDGVLYLRVVDPYKASYGVEDPEFAITQLAQTTMRSELGKISLDSVFRERESLNFAIVEAINKASNAWGIDCLRYEIRDIRLPQRVNEAMQMQVEAERKKRAAILESEGIREADINVAEGKKRARILSSEAEKTEQINRAQGEASAILAKADARARSLHVIADSLLQKRGSNAASLLIAEQYVSAFSKLAKTGNTLILPSNTNDVSSMVAQALAIYKNISPTNSDKPLSEAVVDDHKDWAEYISDDEECKVEIAKSQPDSTSIQHATIENLELDKENK